MNSTPFAPPEKYSGGTDSTCHVHTTVTAKRFACTR